MKVIRIICLLLIVCTQLLVGSWQAHAQTSNIDQLQAQALLLVNANNGQVLYAKNEHETVEVGSLVKLLLIYLVYTEIENGNIKLDDKVVISNDAYQLSQNYDIANVPLRQDFEYTVEELLETVALRYANGSALALAEHIAKEQKTAIELMNNQLNDWGLTNNNIVSLTDATSGNKMTAEALMTVTYRLINDFPEYLELTKVKEKEFKAKTDDALKLTNANSLIEGGSNGIKGADGLAVAYQEKMGYSYVTTSNRDEQRFIAIAVGTSEDDADATFVIEQLLEYAFSGFETRTILAKGASTDQIPELKVYSGDKNTVETVYKESLIASVPLGDNVLKFNYQVELNENRIKSKEEIAAPILKGETLGRVTVLLETNSFRYLPTSLGDSVEIIANEAMAEKSLIGRWWQRSGDFISNSVEGMRKFFTNIFN